VLAADYRLKNLFLRLAELVFFSSLLIIFFPALLNLLTWTLFGLTHHRFANFSLMGTLLYSGPSLGSLLLNPTYFTV
jgi:hypothetical protein